MLKQYEAIYKNGKLQWVNTPPEAIENRRVVVLLDEEGEMPKLFSSLGDQRVVGCRIGLAFHP